MKNPVMLVKKVALGLVVLSPLMIMENIEAKEHPEAPATNIKIMDISAKNKKAYIDYYKSFDEKPAIMWYMSAGDAEPLDNVETMNFLDVNYLENNPLETEEGIFVDYVKPKEGNANEEAVSRLQKAEGSKWAKPLKQTVGDRLPVESLPYEVYWGRQKDKSTVLIPKSSSGGVLTETAAKEKLKPVKELFKTKVCFDNGGYLSVLYTMPKLTTGMTPSLTYDELWSFVTVKDGKIIYPDNIFENTGDVDAYVKGLALAIDCPRFVRDDVNIDGLYEQGALFSVKHSSVLMAQDGVYVKVINDSGSSTRNYISVRIPKELLKPEIQKLYTEEVAPEDMPTPTLSVKFSPKYLTEKPSKEALTDLASIGEKLYTAVGQPTKIYDFMGNGALGEKKSNFETNGIATNYFLWIPNVLDKTGLTAVPDGSMNYLTNEDKDNKNYQAIEKLTKEVADGANEVILRLDEKPSAYDPRLGTEKRVVAQFVEGDSLKGEKVFTCKGDNTHTQEEIAEKVAKARDQYTPIISYDNHGYTSIAYVMPGSRNDYLISYQNMWYFATYKNGEKAPLKDVVADVNGLHLYLIGLANQKNYSEELYVMSDIGPENTNWFITDEGVFLQVGPGWINTAQSAVVIRVPDAFLTKEIKSQYPSPVASEEEKEQEIEEKEQAQEEKAKKTKKVKVKRFFRKYKLEIVLGTGITIGGVVAIFFHIKKKRNLVK